MRRGENCTRASLTEKGGEHQLSLHTQSRGRRGCFSIEFFTLFSTQKRVALLCTTLHSSADAMDVMEWKWNWHIYNRTAHSTTNLFCNYCYGTDDTYYQKMNKTHLFISVEDFKGLKNTLTQKLWTQT